MIEKIKNLIKEMTLEEKASLCSGENSWLTKAVERLDVPSIWLSDGPHGLRKQEGLTDNLGIFNSNPAVSFPSLSTAGASFDRELIKSVGQSLGEQCSAENVSVLLGPGINIKRSPLCGRNFEYFSEDPYLAGELGSSYVEGVQNSGAGACVKHYLANNQETRRFTSSSEIDERTLREIYMPAFESVVKKAQPWMVMCSYNKINGTFASENRKFMTDVLRGEWGFKGCVVSDWGATHNRVKAVAAGTDLTMPGEPLTDCEIVEAVKAGMLPEFLVDTACENILNLVFKAVENKKTDVKIDHKKAHEVSRAAAEQSAVLLKNENNILPLNSKQKIAFIGQFADNPRFQGGGSSIVNAVFKTKALDAVKGLADVTYSQGYDGLTPDNSLIDQAVKVAKQADVAVVFAGVPLEMETEGNDRTHLKLPDSHNALIEAVAKLQKNTVVVLHNGSAVEMPWLENVKGILEMYLGGEGIGEATVNLLFGKVNPSGRLAETFPLCAEDNPSYLYYIGTGNKVEYREGVYVGYRYYESKKQKVLFPFGYGLSYTQFEYSDLKVSKEIMTADDVLTVSVNVKNTGKVAGKEVVQLYVAVKDCGVLRPVKELRGFDKLDLEPGETKTAVFTLDKRTFSYWNEEVHAFHMPAGLYEIQISKSASKTVLAKEIMAIEEELNIVSELTELSLIKELVKHPAGKQFIEENLDAIYDGVIASGIASHVTGRKIEKEEFSNMFTGMYSQPIQVLKMFLPAVTPKEWKALLNDINKDILGF